MIVILLEKSHLVFEPDFKENFENVKKVFEVFIICIPVFNSINRTLISDRRELIF